MSTIIQLTRQFRFGATTLDDIDPLMTPEDVIRSYAGSYPFLNHATLGDPQVEGDTLVYPVLKREVQTKGKKPSAQTAIDALRKWQDANNPSVPPASDPWKQVNKLLTDVIARPATPITDAMLVAMP